MKVYLVRLIDNKELVGIFVVPDTDALYYHVDECTDPNICEAALLPSGGIMWPAPGATKIPVPEKVAEAGDEDFGGSTFTEAWSGHLSGLEKSQWKSIDGSYSRKTVLTAS